MSLVCYHTLAFLLSAFAKIALPAIYAAPMLLTQCAACATELGLSSGKKCGRCSTRYCGPECQVQHWKEGGHDQLCKKIKKAGGAEQYNANQKYTAAVAVAAAACAEDTKGQTCYICTQALHWKTKEGLVRMCSCRGTAGFAHVSCLAEQVKILFEEAEENNLDLEPSWRRWNTCSLCEQSYHGVVKHALGWACWKTYVGRPEADWTRRSAMRQVANGLSAAGHHEDALTVEEAQLSMLRRIGASEYNILGVQNNLAASYAQLGRHDEASRIQGDVYHVHVKLNGEEHIGTLLAALNYATTLITLDRCQEVKSVLRKTMPVARRVLGENHEHTLKLRALYARALHEDTCATLGDIREAVAMFEDLAPTTRRVLGGTHPVAMTIEASLRYAQTVLVAREGDDVSALCDAVDALNT